MKVMAAQAGTATIGGVLLANHLPLLAAVFGLIAAIFMGVALPAVWSAKPARRAAALATLKVLLAIVKRPAPDVESERRSNRTGRLRS